MFYGRVSFSPLSEENKFLNRLKKATGWAQAEDHSVSFGSFSGGFFLDARLPQTADECLYINTSNDMLVLMAGCIYNHADLCTNYSFPDGMPAPALVAELYGQQGSRFVNELNGDFAIFICQPEKKAAHLFRDHAGIIPLAYTLVGQSLYFSTDTIGLCRTFYESEPITIDPFISGLKIVDINLTPNEKVLKIKPGHFLSYTPAGITTNRYWVPEGIAMDHSLTQERMFSELRTLLDDAIRIRSDQRFTAGAHISGGLDSSTVAAVARQAYSQQPTFYGYSWSPANAVADPGDVDERELIKQICQMANLTPAFIEVQVQDFVDLARNSIHNFMYFHEEKVLDLARLHGTNLLFSGWGGDEFISFGSMGVDSDLVFNLQWKTFLKKNPVSQPKRLLKYLLFRVFMPAIDYIPPKIWKGQREPLRYVKNEYRTIHKKTFKRFYCYRSRREFQLGMLLTHHLAERTECWYITGFKNGVAYRYPLLDKRIIEYMLKVPSKLLVKDDTYTRIILREITSGILPESVRWRRGKADPALFAFVAQQTKERGLLFIDEVNEFKANPDLQFIDFDTLDLEIRTYRNNERNYTDSDELFRMLMVIKSLHELTKSYREPIID